jgi:hypothetical protein
MVNKSLFASMLGRLPKANAFNEAGGLAYKLEPKHALAQVAATGTFGNAFYSAAETQLDEVLKLIDEVDDNQISPNILSNSVRPSIAVPVLSCSVPCILSCSLVPFCFVFVFVLFVSDTLSGASILNPPKKNFFSLFFECIVIANSLDCDRLDRQPPNSVLGKIQTLQRGYV